MLHAFSARQQAPRQFVLWQRVPRPRNSPPSAWHAAVVLVSKQFPSCWQQAPTQKSWPQVVPSPRNSCAGHTCGDRSSHPPFARQHAPEQTVSWHVAANPANAPLDWTHSAWLVSRHVPDGRQHAPEQSHPYRCMNRSAGSRPRRSRSRRRRRRAPGRSRPDQNISVRRGWRKSRWEGSTLRRRCRRGTCFPYQGMWRSGLRTVSARRAGRRLTRSKDSRPRSAPPSMPNPGPGKRRARPCNPQR
jgi:hypothetical protein